MKIEKATIEQAPWLEETIGAQFPYTKFNYEKIVSRINNPNYLILIARQENILVGFCELEVFLEEKEARLNGIYVAEVWRDQGIAKAMIAQLINQCKHKRIQRLFLLVKTNNEDAKGLYLRTGFVFEKMHDKLIEDSKVEVWGQAV